MELRLTIARLVWGFDFEEVETPGKGVLWKEGFAVVQSDEYRMRDCFTSRKEGPVARFWKREGLEG